MYDKECISSNYVLRNLNTNLVCKKTLYTGLFIGSYPFIANSISETGRALTIMKSRPMGLIDRYARCLRPYVTFDYAGYELRFQELKLTIRI